MLLLPDVQVLELVCQCDPEKEIQQCNTFNILQ